MSKQVIWDNLPQVIDYSYDSGRSIKEIMKELRSEKMNKKCKE